MTETSSTHSATATERRVIYQSQLLEEISAHAADGKYKGIPGIIRDISVQAAAEALFTPRNDLFEKIKSLKGAQADVNRIGFLHDIWGEDPENIIPRETAKEYMRSKHFTENQRSRLLTKWDRQLLASIIVSTQLARGEQDQALRFDISEVEAAHRLSRDLVGVFIKSLSHSEQWDKNVRHGVMERGIIYTVRLAPEYNDWESHRPHKRKKKQHKHK